MQPPDLTSAADLARLTAAGLGLFLTITCVAGLFYAQAWDQRARFLALLGYAVITVNGQIEALGRVPTWRTYGLAVVGLFAVISTGAFVVRSVRSSSERGIRARRTNDQRRVLGAGPPARRAHRRHRRAGATGGNPS
jgi:hypothetical protein